MRSFPIFATFFLLWIPASQGTDKLRNGLSKTPPHDWPPHGQSKITTDGRNLLIPKVFGGNQRDTFPSRNIPIFRAEAKPNQRLTKTGVNDKEGALFIGVGKDPQRTIDFMQQSRYRETASAMKKGIRPKGKNGDGLFSANKQTIRHSSISPKTAHKVILGSVIEKDNGGKDVLNVDKKDPNQFGIRGQTLSKVKQEIKQNGVSKGTTFGGRRNSMPNIKKTSPGGSMFGFKGSSDDSTKLKNLFGSAPNLASSSTANKKKPPKKKAGGFQPMNKANKKGSLHLGSSSSSQRRNSFSGSRPSPSLGSRRGSTGSIKTGPKSGIRPGSNTPKRGG